MKKVMEMTKRRDSLDIIRDILTFCLTTAKTKTEVRRKCVIDTEKMRHYLEECIQFGFLKVVKVPVKRFSMRQNGYVATQKKLLTTLKGSTFLKKYEDIKDMFHVD